MMQDSHISLILLTLFPLGFLWSVPQGSSNWSTWRVPMPNIIPPQDRKELLLPYWQSLWRLQQTWLAKDNRSQRKETLSPSFRKVSGPESRTKKKWKGSEHSNKILTVRCPRLGAFLWSLLWPNLLYPVTIHISFWTIAKEKKSLIILQTKHYNVLS